MEKNVASIYIDKSIRVRALVALNGRYSCRLYLYAKDAGQIYGYLRMCKGMYILIGSVYNCYK